MSTRVQPVLASAVTSGTWLGTSVWFKAGLERHSQELAGVLFLPDTSLHWGSWGAFPFCNVW